MKTFHYYFLSFFLLLCPNIASAANYTTFLTTARGFTEVTNTDAILADVNYYYILAPAETSELIVGIGGYETKPDWASEESKALRYKPAATDPVLDLANFFTIEKSGQYIGLRNVVYDTDLFQTHDNAGYMYVNTYTDKTLDEWSYLTPTYQDGYWMFENGKYPISSDAQWKGYMGSWTAGRMAIDEPIALNRLNTEGDPAGHYRLFRIAKSDLMVLHFQAILSNNGFTEVTSADGIIANNQYCYLLTAAENDGLYVGIGRYEDKPHDSWTASEETKALRYKSVEINPLLDLSNFFTIEKSGSYIGLRNMVYSADLFQTHDNAGYMYVNTFTNKNLDEWSQLIPTYQNGYWLFESGKYPISSNNWACGYLGPWNKRVEAGEPMALNRRNTEGDEAGHYRLWRIAKTDLLDLHAAQNRSQMFNATVDAPADATWLIANPSFETGDATGWTLQNKDANNIEFNTRDYGMTNKEGGYLMNVYQWWNDHSVSQVINNIPSGNYELSAILCTWSDRTATLTGQTSRTRATATANGVNDQTGTRVSVNVTVGNDQQLIITANSTTDWWSDGHGDDYYKQLFYKVDDVRLTCKGVFLNAYAVPLPNDDTTLLQGGQWYYYDVDFGMDYTLTGNIYNMVFSADGDKLMSGIITTAATRQMLLPRGRVYFKTTRSDATLSLHPARNVEESGTFTAVALNVDGLPNKIATFDLNPDGPGRDGTLKISQYLASKGYDFIGCSEDFNYNGALMEYLDGYSCGTIRNTLSAGDLDYLQLIQGKIHVDTDGLNLLWKNSKISATNESWTAWNSTESTDGNQYVEKGYRHYDVQIDGENGPVIDVYILHMDAGDTNATWSRESQWRQLSDAINSSDHSRAKLIIGDTNSRYTREDVITNFINRLSTDFTMSDVWVEFYRNGIYPTTDMDNLTDQSDVNNYSNYEIVDKIIYINPRAANTVQLVPQSFKIEQDYTYDYVDHDGNTTPLGDHRPVVVTFKYMLSGAVSPLAVTLQDAADNSTAIASVTGALANVTLQDRTLFKDGFWNTICLPFDAELTGDLAGATLKELDTEGTYNGHTTGIDGQTLYLNFKDASSIKAGTPYIIKWDTGTSVTNPVFSGVTIFVGDASGVASTDGSVTFQGTYAPVALTKDDKSNLYLGDGNKLCWPNIADFKVNAFRAFFHLADADNARQFALNFGDGEPSSIADASLLTPYSSHSEWYTIEGTKLDKQPTKKGLYIQNGRKLVVK